jgi:hypothetical protein
MRDWFARVSSAGSGDSDRRERKLKRFSHSNSTLSECRAPSCIARDLMLFGVPSAEGVKNVIDYEIKIPLKIDGALAQDKVLSLKLIQQVKVELESKKVSR